MTAAGFLRACGGNVTMPDEVFGRHNRPKTPDDLFVI